MKVVLEAGYSGYFLDTDRYVKLLLVLLYIINQLKWRYWYLIREYFAILERYFGLILPLHIYQPLLHWPCLCRTALWPVRGVTVGPFLLVELEPGPIPIALPDKVFLEFYILIKASRTICQNYSNQYISKENKAKLDNLLPPNFFFIIALYLVCLK